MILPLLCCFVLIGVVRGQECRLKQNAPSKPVPALTQCYRYHTSACCVSGHDSVIRSKYESLFSSSCLREYSELENYFCIACDPTEFEYVNEDTHTLRVCTDYANQLFNLDYSKCGIKMYVENPKTKTDPGALWEIGVYNASTSSNVVFPKLVFASAQAFLQHLLPPYFEGFTVQIVEGSDDEPCFTSNAAAMSSSIVLLMITTILIKL